LQEAFPGFDAEFRVSRFDQPFAPSGSEELASFLTELTGHAPAMVSFGSEAAHIPAEEVVVFGPGDMTTAHRTGEFVPLEELALCVRCLTACIHRFCGRV
jgi:acetylornithine deacetylase